MSNKKVVLFQDMFKKNLQFACDKQLKDEHLWKQCVEVFRIHSDDTDNGWRGEYWGKMMRGACLTYLATRDEELYFILENSVKDLLTTQDELGRISSYSIDTELQGWDIWGRKYVLSGMFHFYDICKRIDLKEHILTAMRRHADYLLERVGDGKGKISILETSNIYEGLNSATIAEPIFELYKKTQVEKYLDFGKYILSTGGAKTDNLLKIAYEDKKNPYEYPVTKAYEMMSFFEGALSYYEISKDPYYLTVVQNFVKKVQTTDVTIIGCSGCTDEFFDNSSVKQTQKQELFMQETCVTVTWMRLLARLYNTTGESWLMDEIEKSYVNALMGSFNTHSLPSYSFYDHKFVNVLPYDSYSPLCQGRRGIAVGGIKTLPDGSYFGCCACIASAGVALLPLYSIMERSGAIVFNEYPEGNFDFGAIIFEVSKGYFEKGECKIVVRSKRNYNKKILFRIPSWAQKPVVSINGVEYTVNDSYMEIDRSWTDGDEISLEFGINLRLHRLNGKIAYTYGAFVLARDSYKQAEIDEPVCATTEYEMLTLGEGEYIRIRLKNDVLLTDYQSCNKNWIDPNAYLSVWLDEKP